MYSDNAFAQIFNIGIANIGISGADMASSGTGSYGGPDKVELEEC
jgi:hypothetical protein